MVGSEVMLLLFRTSALSDRKGVIEGGSEVRAQCERLSTQSASSASRPVQESEVNEGLEERLSQVSESPNARDLPLVDEELRKTALASHVSEVSPEGDESEASMEERSRR